MADSLREHLDSLLQDSASRESEDKQVRALKEALELTAVDMTREGYTIQLNSVSDANKALNQLDGAIQTVDAKDQAHWADVRERFIRRILGHLSDLEENADGFSSLDQKLKARIESWKNEGINLNEVQIQAALGFISWLEQENRRMGHIVAPMGTGKTWLTGLLSTLVPRAKKTLSIAWNQKEVTRICSEISNLYQVTEKTRTVEELKSGRQATANFLVTHFEALKRMAINWDDIGLVVVDEADVNGLSDSRASLLSDIAGKGIPVLATTATEKQASGKKLQDTFPEEILSLPIPQSLFRMRDLNIVPDMVFEDRFVPESLEVGEEVLLGQEIPPEEVDDWIRKGNLIEFILEDFKTRFQGQRGLVIFRDNSLLNDFLMKAASKSLNAAAMTGEQEADGLLDVRNRLGKRNLDLVGGSRLLGRGADLQADVVYFLGLTRSPQIFWQAFGRGMRKDPYNPNKVAHLINVMPRYVLDNRTKRLLQPEEWPLSFRAFMDPDHFAGVDDPKKRNLQEPKDFEAPIGDLEHIRSNEEVERAIGIYRSKPIDFLGRPPRLAAVLEAANAEPISLAKIYHADKHTKHAKAFAEYMDSKSAVLNLVTDHKRDLTLNEERELLKKYADTGDQMAVNRLMLAHEPVIAAIAKALAVRPQDVDDIAQEGREQFWQTIKAYDCNREKQSRLLRFGIQALFYRMQKRAWNLGNELNEQNTLGYGFIEKNKLLQKIIEILDKQGKDKSDKNIFAESRKIRPASPLFRGELTRLKLYDDKLFVDPETAENTPHPAPLYTDDERLDINLIFHALETLDLRERQKFVLSQYFGLDEEGLTLSKIGEQMGLSKERVRGILFEATSSIHIYIQKEIERKFPPSDDMHDAFAQFSQKQYEEGLQSVESTHAWFRWQTLLYERNVTLPARIAELEKHLDIWIVRSQDTKLRYGADEEIDRLRERIQGINNRIQAMKTLIVEATFAYQAAIKNIATSVAEPITDSKSTTDSTDQECPPEL